LRISVALIKLAHYPMFAWLGGNIENALELHPSLFDRYDTVSFIIEADDRVGVDIFRPADKFAQNEFTPIVLGWGAILVCALADHANVLAVTCLS
jgi:hypothetical protein